MIIGSQAYLGHFRYEEQMMSNLIQDLEVLKDYVQQAGQAIFQMAEKGFDTAYKENRDPVTTADLEADRILKKGLLKYFSQAGWLSEETRDEPMRLGKKQVWIVDPIDGTKEFVSGIPEYSVSVALVENGFPVLATVYNPATEELFSAAKDKGAWLNGEPINARHPMGVRPVLLASRSEIKRDEFKPFEPFAEIRPCGSIAYKLALVAGGFVDATFSLGPKNEWDIAAGVLLVAEAGGEVSDITGKSFLFNQRSTLVDGIVGATKSAIDPVRTLIDRTAIGNKRQLKSG